jgi:hypothetical protein
MGRGAITGDVKDMPGWTYSLPNRIAMLDDWGERSAKYREGWDRIFGKKEPPAEEVPAENPVKSDHEDK